MFVALTVWTGIGGQMPGDASREINAAPKRVRKLVDLARKAKTPERADQLVSQAVTVAGSDPATGARSAEELCQAGWMTDVGYYAAAERAVTAAQSQLERFAPGSPSLGRAYEMHGRVCVSLANPTEGQYWLRRAITLFRQPADNPENLKTLDLIGQCLYQQGDFARSEHLLRQALALANQERIVVPRIYADLGSVLCDQGQLVEAKSLFLQELNEETKRGPGSRAVAAAYIHLGCLSEARGRYAEALAWFRKSLEIRSRLEPFHLNC